MAFTVTPQMVMAGAGIIGDYLDSQQSSAAQERQQAMFDKITETAGIMEDKYNEIFKIADFFKPGGGAWKEAEAQSINQAFMTARKGQEDLLAKGIDMTSYGTSTFRDTVAETFQSELSDKKDTLTNMGSNWANVGTGLMSDWASLLQTAYKGEMDLALEEYKAANSGLSFLDTLAGKGGESDAAKGFSKLANEGIAGFGKVTKLW